jgi:hypothetical protein
MIWPAESAPVERLRGPGEPRAERLVPVIERRYPDAHPRHPEAIRQRATGTVTRPL